MSQETKTKKKRKRKDKASYLRMLISDLITQPDPKRYVDEKEFLAKLLKLLLVFKEILGARIENPSTHTLDTYCLVISYMFRRFFELVYNLGEQISEKAIKLKIYGGWEYEIDHLEQIADDFKELLDSIIKQRKGRK